MMIDAENSPKTKEISKGLAIVAIGSLCILISLGTWQLHRLTWKEDLILMRQAELARPPISLKSPSTVKPEAFRRVELRGRFLHKKEILVGPISYYGRAGWHIVTPLQLVSGDIVLVNRGWVPFAYKLDPYKAFANKNIDLNVVGVVGWPRKVNYFDPLNVPERNQWFRIEPIEMAKKLKLKAVTGYWISINKVKGKSSYPIGGVGIELPINNHLQYALTWYGMALGLIILSIVYWRQRRR